MWRELFHELRQRDPRPLSNLDPRVVRRFGCLRRLFDLTPLPRRRVRQTTTAWIWRQAFCVAAIRASLIAFAALYAGRARTRSAYASNTGRLGIDLNPSPQSTVLPT